MDDQANSAAKTTSVLWRVTGYAPARRLVRGLLPWLSSEFLIRSGIVRLPVVQPSETEEFPADRPFAAGTGILPGLVPPIASGTLRAAAGLGCMTDYLLASDSWMLLANRFLKERSKVLEVGCGCGEVARTLAHHPWIAKYIGVDDIPACIEWCRAAYGSRAPQVFEFHCQERQSGPKADNPEEAIAQVASLPAPDASVDLILVRRLLGGRCEAALARLLVELRRVLALNGLLLAAVPSRKPYTSEGRQEQSTRAADLERFQEIAESVGLETWQRMGLLRDQELFIFRRAVPPPSSQVAGGSPPGCDGNKTGSYVSPAVTAENRVLTEEMLRLNQRAGAEQEVSSEVHPDDFIYWFLATHPLLSLERAIEYYFKDGGTSAAKLTDLVAGFDDLDRNLVKLLEFASGYGCVTRHLKKRRQFELVSCDIHPQALEFLSETLGVKTLASSHHPAGFAPPDKYDVIFALSFFSHMPKRTFGPWLKALFQALHDPGYLVFTTLGLRACRDVGIAEEDIPEDGFWFEGRSEQHDLDQAEYGMTIVTPEFVRAEVERLTGAPIVAYKHVGWWDNQDLWVIKRDS